MFRQHHQDLPAIPEAEEAGADDADEGIIDHDGDGDGDGDGDDDVNGDGDGDGDDDVNGDEDDDDDGGSVDDSGAVEDDSSNVEEEDTSCANSYAFTLDNVGWDEECSLVGSVVGSVVAGPLLFGVGENCPATAAAAHAPPSKDYGPGKKSAHDDVRNVHRETCQKYGLPYSEDWLKFDLSSCGGDTLDKDEGSSFLGSISVSSGSADEPWGEQHQQERRQKIDKLWPWPTTSPKMSKKGSDPTLLDKMAKNSKSPKISADTKGGGGGSLVKEFWTSFNKRVEGAHEATDSSSSMRTVSKGTTNSTGDSSKMTKTTPMEHLSVAESAREVQSHVQRSSPGPDDKKRWQHLVHSYRESSYVTKRRAATAILILILSFVIILVSVGLSKSDGDMASISGNAGNHGPDVSTSHDITESRDISTPVDDIGAAVPVSMTHSTIVPSKSPTFASSLAPVAGPPAIESAPNGVPNEQGGSCVDADGRYQSSGGKRRQCSWLSQNVGLGALYSDSLYAECGEGSELGLNCRYTCRAYNGCLLALERSGVEGGGSGQANQGGGGGSASPTFQVSDTVELMIPATVTNSPTSSPTMGLLRSTALPSIDVTVEMEEALSGESEMTLLSAPLLLQTNTWSTTFMQHDTSTQDMMCVDYEGYYLNHNGQPRQCSWLIDSGDPNDENRRIHNCWYADSNQYSVGTELGKMCKKTCGMCE